MIDKAIARINAEMQQHPSDRMLEAVGQYLIDLCTTEDTAKVLLDEKKTLAGAVAAMREAARKKQHGGYYAMAPDEAWEIVRKYYGISALHQREAFSGDRAASGTPSAVRTPENELPPKAAVDIDFDSFWG